MLLNLIIIIHRKNFYFEATGFKDPLQILNYNQLVDSINPDVIQAAAANYLNLENYMKITLYPEVVE